MALTIASTFSCNMFMATSVDTHYIQRGFGLWTIQGNAALLVNGKNLTTSSVSWATSAGNFEKNVTGYGDYCYPYGQLFGWNTAAHLFDTEMNVAQGFGTAASVLGVILAFWILLMSCCSFRNRPRTFCVMGVFSLLVSTFSGLSFLSLQSTFCKDADTCTLGYSAILCIVATCLWAWTGLVLFCFPPKHTEERSDSHRGVAPHQDKMERDCEAPAVKVVTTTVTREPVEQYRV